MKKVFLLIYIVLSTTNLQADYWQRINTLPDTYKNNYWLDIQFHQSNPQFGWACGFNGQVVRTTDGGNTWSGSTVGGAYHLESIHFPSLNVGYTSGVEGIFKTTDGGATWVEVTPDLLETYWGCFFVDDNNGVVVGGGCALTKQRFYRTSNGGASWTLFEGNEPNSGMCDAMIYPNGSGYASSSGKIWVTTDAGWTWSVLSTTGTNVWQEEITNINNSFLVPTSGANCSGGGIVGGMRFSTNFGLSWKDYPVRNSMFGTFLINETSGWACGYDRQVYFTSDAGNTWQERNCGLDVGNLDDIWFISPTNGWVVGEGIYRLAPSTATANPTALDFDTLCVPALKIDTIWVRNMSFNSALARFSFMGVDANHFDLVSPNAIEETLNSCDSLPIVIRFNPKTLGTKSCTFRININSLNLDIQLTGTSAKSGIHVDPPMKIIDSAYCGFMRYITFDWTSDDADKIIKIVRAWGDSNFVNVDNLPIYVEKATPKQSNFTIIPRDTGWTAAEFTATTLPCEQSMTLTARVYGYSPIINALDKVEIESYCFKDSIIKIPITNTGNTDLIISQISLLGNIANYQFIGFSSGSLLPVKIGVLQFDTLLLRFSSTSPGTYAAQLFLHNNDSTKVRGNKNPFIVNLKTTNLNPILNIEKSKIDFGRVCLGDSSFISFKIKNSGNTSAAIQSYNNKLSEFSLFLPNNEIYENDSLSIRIRYIARSAGAVTDTIRLTLLPCGEVIEIYLTAFGIDNSVELSPQSISLFAQTDIPVSTKLNVISKANATQSIKAIYISPTSDSLAFSFLPNVPIILDSMASVELDLTFIAKYEAIYMINLCLDIEGECPQMICLPIELASRSRWVAIDRSSLDFGLQKCSPKAEVQSVRLTNLALENDTIVTIDLVQGGDEFRIVKLPELPYVLSPSEPLSLDIEFLPSKEGNFTAYLEIKTKEPASQTLKSSLVGSFKRVNTYLSKDTINFGKKEYCFGIIQDTIRFANIGLLDDTLSISYQNINGFDVSKSDTVLIYAESANSMIISADTKLFEAIGLNEWTIKLKSLICGEEYLIKCSIEITKPLLTISPDTLDFGKVWKGDTKSLKINIQNNTYLEKNFRILGLEPQSTAFSLDKKQGKLNSGEKTEIKVTFSADSVGLTSARLIIEENALCFDTSYVELIAIVPAEHYYPLFRIGHYQANPGDTVTVVVSLDSALSRVEANNAEFTIEFDKYLFEPKEIKAVYLPMFNDDIPFDFRNGRLSFGVNDNIAKALLAEKGDKFRITGLALLSLPDSTALTFDKISISANKDISPIGYDGSLKIFGYCEPIAGLRYQIMPTIEIQSFDARQNTIDFKVAVSRPLELSFEMYSLTGEKVFDETAKLTSGLADISIDISSEASGVFYLLVKTNYYQSFTYPIVIVK